MGGNRLQRKEASVTARQLKHPFLGQGDGFVGKHWRMGGLELLAQYSHKGQMPSVNICNRSGPTASSKIKTESSQKLTGQLT